MSFGYLPLRNVSKISDEGISRLVTLVLGPILSFVLGGWLQGNFQIDAKELFKCYTEDGKSKGFAKLEEFKKSQQLQHEIETEAEYKEEPIVQPTVQSGYLKAFFGVVKTYSEKLFDRFVERWSNIKNIKIRASSNQA